MTESADREAQGRFVKGNAGGSGGARRRPSELRRAAEEAITAEHIEAMIRKATRMALEGNLTAMRLVLERTTGRAAEAPVMGEPVPIELPRMHTAADCNAAIEKLIDGIVRGEIDRDAAKLLIDAVQTSLKAIELNDLEGRLAALEDATRVVDTSAISPRRW